MPPNQELIDRRASGPAGGRVPEIAELQTLARWMDSVFEIPGLKVRFGLDAILGLFPGLGDVATSLVAFYILQTAQQRGVSRLTLARMAANILLDWGVGSIPILGDAFDVYWKSNHRNVELLRQHVQAGDEGVRRTRTGDRLFFAMLIGVLAVFLVGSLTLTYFTVTSLAALLRSAVS
ncbi:MAG: DUF4112 domain-containing protein [Planctomycetaceae bacterium]|nr:DUF4112 domain-containing protein [Planctomycetaceae bacterium]